MDELWERQRWSTQIKRKIKTLQKAEKEKQKSTDTLDEIDKVPASEISRQYLGGNNVELVKESTNSVSRESVTDENVKAVSIEDVTVSVIDVHEEEKGWKAEIMVSEEETTENTFANFNEVEDKNFANFNKTDDFADFSSSNEFIDNVDETSVPVETSSESTLAVAEEYDGKFCFNHIFCCS